VPTFAQQNILSVRSLITFYFLAVQWFCLPDICSGQSVNLGDPPVLNFSKKQYKAGTQVWDIAQDKRGIMWFGNNEGLLEFDGIHWRLHPLPNRTIVRSVKPGQDGKIFVGGQDEFGFFAPNASGRLVFHSLRNQVKEPGQQLGDCWNIAVRPEGVFFRTDHQLFWYHAGKTEALFPPGTNLHFMGEWKGRLLIQDGTHKLYVFDQEKLKSLDNPAEFTGGTISGVVHLSSDSILVTTIKNGIFLFDGQRFVPWNTQEDEFLKSNIIFCAGIQKNSNLALGTSLNGLVILDRQRRIFRLINKKNGLQNNTILSLFIPEKGGIWLGLDNGIDFVDASSPFSTVYPDGELQGTGYTARVFGDNIYFGTNTGLYANRWTQYYTPTLRKAFSKVQHSEGQVWSLGSLDNRLLMGHHEGPFEVLGLSAKKLANIQGIWKFVEHAPGLAIAGHYNGLSLFERTASGWKARSYLQGLKESSRLLAKDRQNNIWMAHPYRGIFRIKVLPESDTLLVDFFDHRHGLPSASGNHLYQIGGEVVFTGETGIYTFLAEQQKFVPDTAFMAVFGSGVQLRYLLETPDGDIWYATQAETGLLKVQNGALGKKVTKIPIPELTGRLSIGFPFILPVDAHNVFLASDQGFIHFDPDAYFSSKDTTLRLVLHEISLKTGTDSVLFGGHSGADGKTPMLRLSARQNALLFSYAVPDVPGGEYIRYAHYLEGAARGWSDWTHDTELLFNNLPPGHYTFHLKARNQHGIESAVIRFSFHIAPPWYASPWAYLVYLLLAAGIFLGIIHRQQQKFAREKRGLVNLHRQQTQHSEEAISRLLNEKLEAEVRHKNQELASATLHIVQKSEILNAIHEALERLKQSATGNAKMEREIHQIIKMLEQDARTDADWEQFSHHFDQVHSDFLKRLGEAHAHLSPNDYKLCAYLRLNLSSKEIAALMNISLRGVESSRYRLRKRLGLDTEENLTDYLMRF
jgi:ligand-binding sensor domain-containing protein/DNA-binding CsgD family transcriptional regulator